MSMNTFYRNNDDKCNKNDNKKNYFPFRVFNDYSTFNSCKGCSKHNGY